MIATLDTLVQVGCKEANNILAETNMSIRRRAVRVAKTKKLIWSLVDLHSPIEKRYWNAYYCCRDLKQEGQYITSKYCNTRWCFECNAIRAAKMINGYKPIFDQWKGRQFVTLTRPNVSGEQLFTEIDDILHTSALMLHYIPRYKGVELRGFRKLEVTYNNQVNSYHPHLHFIVEDLMQAKLLVGEWLFRNPAASPAAQHIKRADDNSFIELFKYATKEVIKGNTPPEALDLVFQSITGRRIYQAFGVQKHISEDIDKIDRQAYGMLEPCTYKSWTFNDELLDWCDPEGNLLVFAVTGITRNKSEINNSS